MTNSDYQLTWVTSDLAVGYAPMSYDELDSIKSQGVDAIVNLCAEFSDLHEIEETKGFEVYYLPIWDETAPDMKEMEKGLEWLDEAIYLGKKVLVHCRHGIGRTGTFVTSYLLRRGLGLKIASKKLEYTRATPASYSQWKLLKKYSKKSGVLKIREPSLESKNVVDLSAYFTEYESVIQKLDADIKKRNTSDEVNLGCGLETDEGCFKYFEIQFIEAIYLHNKLNKSLQSTIRLDIINQAIDVLKKTRRINKDLCNQGDDTGENKKDLIQAYNREKILCPLHSKSKCSLYEHRPIRCKYYGVSDKWIDYDYINNMLFNISRNVFLALSGFFLENKSLAFPPASIASGRFVQDYFYYLAFLTSK